MKGGAWSIAVLVVWVLVNCVDAQSPYSCWRGCYNQCFLGSVKPKPQRLACENNCLNTCIPPTPAAVDFEFYCQIGCSLKSCIPASIDSARMVKCFGLCTNLCSGTPTTPSAPSPAPAQAP